MQRPFHLDLVLLQAIPLFKGLPEIWIKAFLVQFEARLPCFLWFKVEYGNPLDWNAVQCVMDGCQNKDLLELLKKWEKELIINELVLEWLLDNLEIDK